MATNDSVIQGAGIGLRAQHYSYILNHLPVVPWFEAITENYLGAKATPLSYLCAIREHYPLTLHGVSLSIGSTDPLNQEYLKSLKQLINQVEPAWISDHLCWTSVDGRYFPELFPLPHHEDVIKHVAERIIQVQDFLGQRILIENISRYLAFKDQSLTEWEFLSEVSRQADCDILLDVNNLYVNACNHQLCIHTYLAGLPKERVKQFHLAGHRKMTTHLLDTHDQAVTESVWDCFKMAISILGAKPALIEWDSEIPPFPILLAQANKAETYYQLESITA